MTTANAVTALSWADQHTKDSRYRPAADRGLAWIAANKPETTQDRVYKILALTAHGTADQKLLVTPLVEQLFNEQQTDGGWMEHGKQRGSNALSTGQVLYALKQAGVSVHAPFFTRGVAYLMETQVHDTPTPANGSWKATNTDSNRSDGFRAHDVGRDWSGRIVRRDEDRQSGDRRQAAAASRAAAAGAQPRGRARRLRIDEREAGRLDAVEHGARRARPAPQVAARGFQRRAAGLRSPLRIARSEDLHRHRARRASRQAGSRSPSRRRQQAAAARGDAARLLRAPDRRRSQKRRRRRVGHSDHGRRGKLQGRSRRRQRRRSRRPPSISRSTSSASRSRARRPRSSSAGSRRPRADATTARRTAASSRAR